MVVICHFTKYIQLYTLKNIQSAAVGDKLAIDDVAHLVYLKRFWPTDVSIVDIIYEYLDIQPLKTTPFLPSCNVQSERTLETTKGMIKVHVNEEKSDLDFILSNSYMHIIRPDIKRTEIANKDENIAPLEEND